MRSALSAPACRQLTDRQSPPAHTAATLQRSLKRAVHARAYLDFNTHADVLEFKAKFDGHAFVSTKGTQYKCSVEYAPFQRVPKPPKKRVPLEGTIEKGGQRGVCCRTQLEQPAAASVSLAVPAGLSAEGTACAESAAHTTR